MMPMYWARRAERLVLLCIATQARPRISDGSTPRCRRVATEILPRISETAMRKARTRRACCILTPGDKEKTLLCRRRVSWEVNKTVGTVKHTVGRVSIPALGTRQMQLVSFTLPLNVPHTYFVRNQRGKQEAETQKRTERSCHVVH
jgi:hypothetical protein